MSVTRKSDLAALPPETIQAILTHPYVAADRALRGQGMAVVDFIETLPLDAQKDILAALDAVAVLATNGQALAVAGIRAAWDRGGGLPPTAKQAPVPRAATLVI